MNEEAGEVPQHCLTPPESATIIATLCAEEAREKGLARRAVWLQMAVTLVVAGIVYGSNDAGLYAVAVLCGGSVSVLNGALLAWRMSRTALPSTPGAHHSDDAHHQLRLMYFYAAERFLAVVALLGLCLVALKLPPLAVLCGFVAGQAAFLVARLFLNGFLTKD